MTKLEKILKQAGKLILFTAGLYLGYKALERLERKEDSLYNFKDGYEGMPFYQIQRIKREEEHPLFI